MIYEELIPADQVLCKLAAAVDLSFVSQRPQLSTTGPGSSPAVASSFGYASASAHGCRGPGTNIAGGTTNGGRSLTHHTGTPWVL